jgi:hypothetical protein
VTCGAARSPSAPEPVHKGPGNGRQAMPVWPAGMLAFLRPLCSPALPMVAHRKLQDETRQRCPGTAIPAERGGPHVLSLPRGLPESLAPPTSTARKASRSGRAGQRPMPAPAPSSRAYCRVRHDTVEGHRTYSHALPAGCGRLRWPGLGASSRLAYAGRTQERRGRGDPARPGRGAPGRPGRV